MALRIFQKFALVCLTVLLSAGWAQSARAWDCNVPDPVMAFGSTTAKTKYNVSNSAWNLTGYHNSSGITLGLAYSLVHFDFVAQYATYEIDGKLCVVLDKIKIYFRARPVVFLSSEFPRGSCEFNEVLYHENKHVKAMRKFHKEYTAKAKQRATEIIEQVRPVGPVNEFQLESARQKIQAQVQKGLDDYIKEIYPELRKRQTIVDSPSEYARVQGECENWSQRLRLQ